MKDKYRKKPVVIEAVQWTGDNWDKVKEFTRVPQGRKISCVLKDQLIISTLEGEMTAEKGDWIIKGVKGEFYPCKPDIFSATYEPAD